jgi:hypothetical protein
MPTSSTTRRGLLTAAAAAYVTRATGALGADATTTPSDPELLRELVAIEQLLIVVYRRVIATGLLSPRVHRIARRVLTQEVAHARAVTRELRALGGTPARPLHTTDTIDKALSDLKVTGQVSGLRNEHDCVHLLLDLEMAAEGAYFNAISALRSMPLTQLAVTILASEAQHQTAVSEARRPGDASQAVPTSFVKGTS